MVCHQTIDRAEVADVLRRRWPGLAVRNLADEQPLVAMSARDAAELGRCRRGIEPLRVVVLPQRVSPMATTPVLDAMPVCV